MKKILSALALLLVVAGCSNTPKEPEKPEGPAAITTLDCATFAEELGNTATENVRVYVADYEKPTSGLVELNLDSDDLKNEIKTVLSGLELEKAENQDKVYGTALFFVDLNKTLDTNYARVILIDSTLTVQTREGFVNYTVDDEAAAQIKVITDALIDAYVEEE